MSRFFKSNQIILDNKKYEIKHKLVKPIEQHVHGIVENQDEGSNHMELTPEVDVETMVQERMDQAESDIRERMQDAEDDREKMISEAFDESKEIREVAKLEGHTEGYNDGFSEGRKIADGIITDALEIKAQLVKRKEEIVKELEVEAVELIIDTVELVLNKHVEEDYELILGIVKKALEKCAFTSKLTLRVSNEDFSMAISLKNRILALAESVDDIDIKADNSLRQGSCVLDTSAGSIDSSIWTQFEYVKETYEILLRSE